MNIVTVRRYSDELYHHGITGQQWGKRRFQNKDGSLTPAGRLRYANKGNNSRSSSSTNVSSNVTRSGGSLERGGGFFENLADGARKTKKKAQRAAEDAALAMQEKVVDAQIRTLMRDPSMPFLAKATTALLIRTEFGLTKFMVKANRVVEDVRDGDIPQVLTDAAKSVNKAIDNGKKFIDKLFSGSGKKKEKKKKMSAAEQGFTDYINMMAAQQAAQQNGGRR